MVPPAPPTAVNTRQNPQATTSPKNIVLCFDGSGNSFSKDLTSIPVLFSLLSADPTKQMCYYQTGIGTYEPNWTPSGILKAISRKIDFFVATGLPQHVQDGYSYLMENYNPGDAIFLFGFSRGAFTARALAGMLQQVGLLLPGNEQSVSLAYSIYAGKDKWLVKPKCENNKCLECGELMADAFKRSFSRETPVHFVGVFDTVASVGALIPRTLPFADGGHEILHFRQALSLDERRARFPPQLWMESKPTIIKPCTAPKAYQHALPDDQKPSDYQPTDVKQLWFPGCHNDIGGGRLPTDGDVAPRLSHTPLRWMIREAHSLGLLFDITSVTKSPLYQPYLEDLDSSFRALKLNLDGPEEQKRYLTQLVTVAAENGPRMIQDARANRGDDLSLFDREEPGGLTSRLFSLPGRIQRTGGKLAWWILEVIPTLRIVWNIEGKMRSWQVLPNLGLGRKLPPNQTFHQSVKIRQETKAVDFPPGDNRSVNDTGGYHPAVRGSIKDVEYAI